VAGVALDVAEHAVELAERGLEGAPLGAALVEAEVGAHLAVTASSACAQASARRRHCRGLIRRSGSNAMSALMLPTASPSCRSCSIPLGDPPCQHKD
jgi:hypothetical protein